MDVRPDSSPTAVPAEGRPAGAGKGSRGCLGCLASGSLGCGAFVVGAILAVGLFAPQLLGGWAARGAETWLSHQVDGRVTVGGAELSWGEGTRLREVALVDEDDKELLRGSLRGPSLTEIMSEFRDGPPQVRATLHMAHFTIDEARGLDLARVLRWQGFEPLVALWRRVPGGPEQPFRLTIHAPDKVRIVDEREGGYELVLSNPLLNLERAPGARATKFDLTCGIAEATTRGAQHGRLEVSLDVAAQDLALPSTVALVLEAEDLPARAALLLLEALAGGFGAELPHALTSRVFGDLAGGHLDLALSVEGDVQAGADVVVSLASERGEARLTGRVLDGVLRLDAAPTGAQGSDVAGSDADGGDARGSDVHAQASCEVHWQVEPELARQALAPLVPKAWELAVVGTSSAAPRVRARTDSLVLDTGFGRGWDADFTLVELSADVRCDAALTLAVGLVPSATIVARDPLVLVRWLGPLGGSITALWPSAGSGAPSAAPDGAPLHGSATLRFEPSLVGDGVGPVGTRAPTSIAVDVDLPGLPVELLRVAASLPAEGAALLGESVRVQVTGLCLGGAGANTALDFALYAGVGRVPVRGRLEGGVARAAGDGPQSLSFPGDRATLARLLGPVLPWIDAFEAAGPGPITVTFSDLEVPLDGGTLRPDGSLEFAPPALRVRLAAPIAALFGQGDTPAWTIWHPRKFRVELNDELVRYGSIELPIAGERFPFTGSFDRATREVNLKGEVPMRLVQDSEWSGTKLAQLLVDSDEPVLVILSGPVGAPQRAIGMAKALGDLSRRLDDALGGVVPAVRGALDQMVPRPGAEPTPPVTPTPGQREPPPGGG